MEDEAEIQEEAQEMGSQKPKLTVKARVSRPPHNYVAIVKDADVPIDTSSFDKLSDQLYHGVVLQQRKRKYWVDENLNKNCFMVFPRELAITWSDSNQYWEWKHVKESGNVYVEVAELRSVSELEISGKFRTIVLSPNTLYKVSLEVSMTESSQGWDVPVNINVTLPDATKQDCHKILKDLDGEKDLAGKKHISILMGEFTTSCENIGEITFCISEKSAEWKQGLVVKGVAFRPKN